MKSFASLFISCFLSVAILTASQQDAHAGLFLTQGELDRSVPFASDSRFDSVGSVFGIKWQRRNYFNIMLLIKFGQVKIFFVGPDDGKIATHNYVNIGTGFFNFFNKPAKVRIHFGGAAGKVNCF